MDIEFLTVADVLEIHADQTARYGGDPGVRDFGLLESAFMQKLQQRISTKIFHISAFLCRLTLDISSEIKYISL